MNKIYDCLIIGCGPCGVGAALELQKASKSVAIIEKSTPGGKINIAPRVDNYPGHKEIPGVDLAMVFYQRVLDNKIELIPDEVVELSKDTNCFKITCKSNVFCSKTVLIASGTKERELNLDHEKELFGHGLSYCAVCDGHFFKNKDVLVIGGGNSALKEAIYLADIVKTLYLIHRRTEFRGNDKLVAELAAHNNVKILTPFVPVELIGVDTLKGVKIKDVNTENTQILDVQGVFPLVGQLPNSTFIKINGIVDERGTIPVDKTMMSRVNGVFAGGDILPRDIRQIYLAEHDGKVAAKGIIDYLAK